MVVNAESKRSPAATTAAAGGNGEKGEESTLFSPRFRSVAQMAGWDEEALLIASLVVEDTPDRHIKHNNKRRSVFQFKTPPTNSTRKRRPRRGSPVPVVPVAVLDLHSEDENSNKESEKEKKEMEKKKGDVAVDKKMEVEESTTKMEPGVSVIPCMDRLREELSCAICLEICYEPSTTPCGHSFCKKCLRSAADKCGKRCPKCRQLISNGRSCTVNTVLWNTIQLLFPQEIEARKASAAVVECGESKSQTFETHTRTQGIHSLNGQEGEVQHTERRRRNHHLGNRIVRPSTESGEVRRSERRREDLPVQDEDAALALRLQREEFMEAFRPTDDGQQQTSASLMLARANLRAMASRAINVRARGRQN